MLNQKQIETMLLLLKRMSKVAINKQGADIKAKKVVPKSHKPLNIMRILKCNLKNKIL